MATLTINTTSAQDTRISAAYGKLFGTVDANGDPRGATLAEVKEEVIRGIKNTVLEFEKRQATDLAEAGIIEIDPT